MRHVCSEFLPRCHSDLCHICLQPAKAHPTDADSGYWWGWLVSELEFELEAPIAARIKNEVYPVPYWITLGVSSATVQGEDS